MIQRAWGSLGVAAMLSLAALPGCKDNGGTSSDALSFVDPTDGATLGAADDLDAAAPGVQYNVKVLVTNEVDADTLSLRVGDGEPATIALSGEEDEAERTFLAFTVPVGDNTLTLELVADGEVVDDVSIDVLVEDEATGETPTLTFVDPADGATLTLLDDVDNDVEGLQVDVLLELLNVPQDTATTLQVNGGNPIEVASGRTGALFESVDLPEGPVTLRAAVTVNGSEYTREATVTVDLTPLPDPTLTILEPVDGTAFTTDDDADPEADGFQLDVLATSAAIPAGTEVQLSLNGAPTATASIEADQVLFEGVTLAEGETTLRMVAQVDGVSVEDAVTVSVAPSGCAITLSPLPSDEACAVSLAGGDASPETDGVQLAFSVETTCSFVELQVNGEVATGSTVTEGAVTFDLITVSEGTTQIQVTGRDGELTGATPVYEYVVDVSAPTVVATAPQPGVLLTPADDLDAGAAGLQVAVTGTSDVADGGEVAITVDGVLAATAVANDDGTWSETITLSESGARVIAATSIDSCGNLGESDAIPVTVYVDGVALAIASPAADAAFGLADDADAATAGLQIDALVTSDLPDAIEVSVECRIGGDATYTGLGSGTIAGGESTIRVTLPEGTAACRATVVEPLVLASADTAWTIDLTAPTVVIATPVEGALFTTRDIAVRALFGDIAEGESVTATLQAGDLDAVALDIVSGAAETTLSLPTDGEWTLTVQATDAVGNAGTASVTIGVDTVPVTINPFFPRDGDTLVEAELENRLDGIVLEGEVILGAVTGPTSLCAASNGGAPSCVSTASNGPQPLPEVFVLPGANTLVISATDAAGNLATLELAFTVDVELPRIVITAPTDGLSTRNATVLVTATSDLPAGAPAAVFVNDTEVAETTASTGGAISFAGVALNTGANAIRIEGSDARGTGTSAPVLVTRDLESPVVTFVRPTDGALIGLDSPDASDAPGFQYEVQVQVDDNDSFEDEVELTVACAGSTLQTRTGTTTSGVATFSDITLPLAGSCTFRATATDAAGNTGDAEVVAGVDRVAPTIVWQQPVDGASLLATVDVSADPGMQANLRVRVDGSAIGQRVTVTVEQGGSVVGTYQSAALTAVNQTVTLSAVPLPEGSVTLRATVNDGAGNPATATIAVTVASDLSGLFVTAPTSGATLNAASDVNAGTAGLQFNASANVFGSFSGAHAHLCIESADAGLTPCARAGYRSLASADITGGVVTWSGVTLPQGLVRLTGEIELGDGSLVNGRNTVSATVDSIRPALVTFTLPGDTDGNGTINASEDATPGGAANVSAQLTFSGLEDGRTVTVRSSVPSAGTVVGTGTVTGGVATVALALSQGTQTLTASATDLVGNPLEAGAPTVVVTVDTAAPTLAVVAPTSGATLRAADDEDGAPGLQFTVAVTSNAGSGRDVSIEAFDGAATPLGLIPLAGTSGSEQITLPEGTYSLRATVSDAAGNPTQVSLPIVVDSIAPAVTVTAPATATVINVTADDDEDPAPGLQIAVRFTTTNATLGDAVVVRSSLVGAPVATTTLTTLGEQEVLVTLPVAGSHVITVQVTDSVGNEGSATGGTIAADFASCGIVLTQPSTAVLGNVAADDGNAANGFAVAFAFTTVDPGCDGETATLVYEPADGGPVSIVGTTVVAANAGSFGTVAVADGTDGFFFVEVDQSGEISLSDAVSVVVDVTAPTIDDVVPGGENPNRIGIADASGFGVGTVDLSVAFTESNGGTLEVYLDGSLLTTVDTDTSPALLPGFAMAEGAFTLDFVFIDEVGNESATVTENYVVDWTAPGAVAFTVSVTDRRNGVGTLDFTGSTAGIASYSARYATTPIVDEDGWLAATSIGTVPATNGALALNFGPLPLFQQTYHFALRAVDGVGNEGPLSSGSAETGMLFSNVATTLTSATWTAWLRDINGDGFDDWAVGGAVSGSPRVVVVYGGSDLTTPVVQTLTAPVGASSFWGATVYAVGDVNGDGFDDVVLPDAISSAAYLYLGTASGIPATPAHRIQYTGASNNFFASNFHQGMGNVIDVDGDATDDGIDDIVLAAPFESTAPGARVLVIAGRTTWPAQLDVSTDAALNTAAGAATFTHSVANSQFGYRTVVVPDVDGDGLDDLAVTARNTGIASTFGGLYFFDGGTLCASGCDYGPAARAHTAADGGPWTGNRSGSGWGTEGVAGTEDLDGDGTTDLLVADVLDIAFDVVLGGDPMPASISYASTITGYPSATFRVGGNVSMLGDLRLNYNAPGGETPYSDLAVAIRNAPSTASFNDVVVFLNNGAGRFSNSPATAASVGLGGVLPMGGGDANGDGFRDFVLFLPNAAGGTFRLCY